jgi:hypothetical protein
LIVQPLPAPVDVILGLQEKRFLGSQFFSPFCGAHAFA